MFEVYTYFGRIISQHIIENETHHRAAEEARLAAHNYPGEAWVRLR